jgi:hypothetical protein
VRQGASWTAAYHLQPTVAAVTRPVRSSMDALGVLAAERSWLLLTLTASARRSVQPVARGRASSPWSTLPAAKPRRRSPLSSRRCPPSRSRRPGSGCPAVRCPVTWGRRPEGPAVGRPLSTRPASSRPLSTRPVSSRLVSAPRPSGRVRLLPLRRWRWGPGRGGRATVTTGTGGDPVAAGRRRLDRRSRRPGRGRRCQSRVGQWEVGGGPGPPGLGAGRGGRACPLSDQAGQAGDRSALVGGGAVDTGAACSARWRHPPRGCRPRAGSATTVRGRRRA